MPWSWTAPNGGQIIQWDDPLVETLRGPLPGGTPQYLTPAQVIPPLAKPRAVFDFFMWSVISTLRAGFNLLRGRWMDAVMLAEEAKAMRVYLQDREKLAEEYLFSHQHAIGYRPLWTYEAEKKGCLITLYFYSTNNVPLRYWAWK